MSWEYGFFNSVNGDRLYNADHMSHIFEGLITDGIYESVGNKLAVELASESMTIQINTGRGWFNNRWVNNSSLYQLSLETSDVTLNRYCAVCIRVDNSDSVRSAEPYLKYSEFATAPVKPEMERSEYIKEYCLAYVYIPAKATVITAENIEDTRFNSDLCGWVTGLITQVDSTTLFTQWNALFNGFMNESAENFTTWFSGLQDFISSDVETALVDAVPKNLTVTLTSADWVDNTQNVNVVGMNDTKSVIVQANEETKDIYTSAGIKCTAQSTNQLTFTCDSVPNSDIKVDILHMG